MLLDTLGGAFEELARERSLGALALGTAVVLLKTTAGLLALALVQLWGARLGRRLLLIANGGASAVLVVWGGANVLVGATCSRTSSRHQRQFTSASCVGTSSSGTCGSSCGASRSRWPWCYTGVSPAATFDLNAKAHLCGGRRITCSRTGQIPSSRALSGGPLDSRPPGRSCQRLSQECCSPRPRPKHANPERVPRVADAPSRR